jgi:hypothetical protein
MPGPRRHEHRTGAALKRQEPCERERERNRTARPRQLRRWWMEMTRAQGVRTLSYCHDSPPPPINPKRED